MHFFNNYLLRYLLSYTVHMILIAYIIVPSRSVALQLCNILQYHSTWYCSAALISSSFAFKHTISAISLDVAKPRTKGNGNGFCLLFLKKWAFFVENGNRYNLHVALGASALQHVPMNIARTRNIYFITKTRNKIYIFRSHTYWENSQ